MVETENILGQVIILNFYHVTTKELHKNGHNTIIPKVVEEIGVQHFYQFPA